MSSATRPRPQAAVEERPPAPLRVLFVSHSFPPTDRPLENVGGMQRVAADLAEALGRDPDIRCTVVGLHATWRWTHARTPGFVLRVLWCVRRVVRSGEVDVVLFSSLVTASVLLALSGTLSRRGVRAAAIVYGREVSRPFRPMRRLLQAIVRRLDVVLPISRAAADESIRRGAEPTRVRIVPCGVDPTRFGAMPERDAARAELSRRLGMPAVEPQGLLLASVGRHVRRKGFEWFVREVFPRLPGQVTYWLAGAGPETESIAGAIAECGCEGRVRLLGKVPHEDLVRLYRAADAFVMPNVQVEGDLEGFGVVIIEAGLCGAPTLSADIEGMRDVVTEGENGWLVPAEDPEAWEAAIAGLLRDRTKLEAMQTRVAAYTERRFAWAGVVTQYRRALTETAVPRAD